MDSKQTYPLLWRETLYFPSLIGIQTFLEKIVWYKCSQCLFLETSRNSRDNGELSPKRPSTYSPLLVHLVWSPWRKTEGIITIYISRGVVGLFSLEIQFLFQLMDYRRKKVNEAWNLGKGIMNFFTQAAALTFLMIHTWFSLFVCIKQYFCWQPILPIGMSCSTKHLCSSLQV